MPIHNALLVAGNPQQPSPQALQLAGPILAVEIGLHTNLVQVLQQQNQPIPAAIAGQGLIDTGASVTAVDVSVLSQLQIQPVGVIQVGTAGGQQRQQLYPAKLRFPAIGFEGQFAQVIGCDLTGQGIIALIGRDVLSRALFVYNGGLGHFILSF